MLVKVKVLRYTDSESDKHWGGFIHDRELFTVWKKASQSTFRVSKITLNRSLAHEVYASKYREKYSKGYSDEGLFDLEVDISEEIAREHNSNDSSSQKNVSSLSWMFKFNRKVIKSEDLLIKSFNDSSKILGHECFDDVLYDDGSYSICASHETAINENTIGYKNYEGAGILELSSFSWRPILSLLNFSKEIIKANPSDSPCLFFADETGREVSVECDRESLRSFVNKYDWNEDEVMGFAEKLGIVQALVKFTDLKFPEYDLF